MVHYLFCCLLFEGFHLKWLSTFCRIQKRQSGMKTGGVVISSGLKTGVLWVQRVKQMEACSTGLRVPPKEFLFNCTQIFLFLKLLLWKVFSSHIRVHYDYRI